MIFILVPAVVIGAIVMNHYMVPMTVWGKNLLIVFLGLIISLLFTRDRRSLPLFALITACFLLLCTFIHPGMLGAHRWINIGPLQIHIASMLLPYILIVLNRAAIISWWRASFFALFIALLLYLQPDAAQLTAFVLAVSVILFPTAKSHIVRFCFFGILFIPVVLSWVFIDHLPVVAHVEGIIQLMLGMDMIWFSVLGIGSLLLMPLPFFTVRLNETDRMIAYALGIYITCTLIAPFFGNFPVPLMGYGVSPIVGYYIALIWLRNVRSLIS